MCRCVGTIFDGFANAGRLPVLLELLEPYILNDRLRYMTPVAMRAFVEHYEATGQVTAVERCFLHLDTRYDDLGEAVQSRSCREHGFGVPLCRAYVCTGLGGGGRSCRGGVSGSSWALLVHC